VVVLALLQGEVEVKDADEAASHVSIEIEKTGHSELQTYGVTVNHTLFDVGHGSIFVLQLVRTNTPTLHSLPGRNILNISDFNVTRQPWEGHLRFPH